MKVLFAIACIAIGIYFLFLTYWSYRVSKKIKLEMASRDKDRLENRLRVKQELNGISTSRRSVAGSTRAALTNRDSGSDALVLASVLSASESGSSGSYSSGCYGSSSSSSDSSSSSCSSD